MKVDVVALQSHLGAASMSPDYKVPTDAEKAFLKPIMDRIDAGDWQAVEQEYPFIIMTERPTSLADAEPSSKHGIVGASA
jgi:hypothetical protein